MIESDISICLNIASKQFKHHLNLHFLLILSRIINQTMIKINNTDVTSEKYYFLSFL